MQVRKHTSKGSTLALKPRADVTRSPKQWLLFAPQKGLMPSKNAVGFIEWNKCLPGCSSRWGPRNRWWHERSSVSSSWVPAPRRRRDAAPWAPWAQGASTFRHPASPRCHTHPPCTVLRYDVIDLRTNRVLTSLTLETALWRHPMCAKQCQYIINCYDVIQHVLIISWHHQMCNCQYYDVIQRVDLCAALWRLPLLLHSQSQLVS